MALKKQHPFRRAFWLAAVFAAMMIATGTPSLYETFAVQNVSASALAFAVMIVPGAFLAALPERIRHRREPRRMSTWQGCLLMLVAGVALMLGAGMAGAGEVRAVAGAMQGGIGALAFVICAWLTAFVAARLADRRRV